MVDLVGQRRALCPTQIYFATDDTFLVNIANERPLVFHSDGTVVDMSCSDLDMSQPLKVMRESAPSNDYNKFIVLKDSEQKMCIVECKPDRFVQYMDRFDFNFIK